MQGCEQTWQSSEGKSPFFHSIDILYHLVLVVNAYHCQAPSYIPRFTQSQCICGPLVLMAMQFYRLWIFCLICNQFCSQDKFGESCCCIYIYIYNLKTVKVSIVTNFAKCQTFKKLAVGSILFHGCSLFLNYRYVSAYMSPLLGSNFQYRTHTELKAI